MNTIIVGDIMYKKIDLAYDSLEPVIDSKTLYLHYNKYYLDYLNKLNSLVDGSISVIDILKNVEKFDIGKRADILYNAGGTYNHELYFNSMSDKPYKENKLVLDIIKQYNSYDNFKEEFINTANKLVGSGYTFLVLNDDKFDIVNMPNEENPYIYGMVPLIALDLFEHAYYIKYNNNRNLYIKNFFSIINFDKAEKIYEENKKK